MILHICSQAEWAVAEEEGVHAPASLDEVGFVHCSDPGTAHIPANAVFAGRTDLVLLVIDPVSLDATVRWEQGVPEHPAGILFPHVYGPINTSAVLAVVDFPPDESGVFALPRELAEQ
ncbi:DUF952 domain-containing protein [Kutzneria viridogrisea]|uniref:Glutathione S-transferase domain-containing protein n=2 Tax=Kutzneria TaxID=43356 RepID=W5W5K0_9PSEU|nr:DUF952 domain-containing protein [Kutzneria albida]AHH93484.1 hypothetical protein KALB_107 [Kutzneria albida DSM 43870]MBA8929130.1 uncharacterized protein (DUF952 family) [Kutzneria viridogrisea]